MTNDDEVCIPSLSSILIAVGTIHVLRNQDLWFSNRNDRKVHLLLYRTIFAELALSCQGAKYDHILLCSSLAQSYFFVFLALIIPSKSSGVKRCPYLYLTAKRILKSVHFKKTVAQSSFLSKVLSFSLTLF